MSFSHSQHVLQLGSIGRQQCYVQHPLRHRLFGGIAVGIQCLPSLQHSQMKRNVKLCRNSERIEKNGVCESPAHDLEINLGVKHRILFLELFLKDNHGTFKVVFFGCCRKKLCRLTLNNMYVITCTLLSMHLEIIVRNFFFCQ